MVLLSKEPHYYYDAEAIKEPSKYPEDNRKSRSAPTDKRMPTGETAGVRSGSATYETRNKRSVWTIPTAQFPEAHFATFPPKLIEPCILAGTSQHGCCDKCGAPWERTMERNAEKEYNYKPVGIVGEGPQRGRREGSYGNSQYKATGWEPTCQCNAAVVPCTVLDPFVEVELPELLPNIWNEMLF